MEKKNRQEEIAKMTFQIKEKMINDFSAEHLGVEIFLSKVKEISFGNKYALWIIQRYLDDGIQRFEDLDRTAEALSLFHKYKQRLPEKDRNILNIKKLTDLENLVYPFVELELEKEYEKMNKEKIYSETKFIYEGPEGKIVSPQTKEASIFWGKGTKWCTAAIKSENYFESYNTSGPLYIFISNEKDENGREKKYQLQFEGSHFMDSEDRRIDDMGFKEKIFDIFEKIGERQNYTILKFLKDESEFLIFTQRYEKNQEKKNFLLNNELKISDYILKDEKKLKTFKELGPKFWNVFRYDNLKKLLKEEDILSAIQKNGYFINEIPCEILLTLNENFFVDNFKFIDELSLDKILKTDFFQKNPGLFKKISNKYKNEFSAKNRLEPEIMAELSLINKDIRLMTLNLLNKNVFSKKDLKNFSTKLIKNIDKYSFLNEDKKVIFSILHKLLDLMNENKVKIDGFYLGMFRSFIKEQNVSENISKSVSDLLDINVRLSPDEKYTNTSTLDDDYYPKVAKSILNEKNFEIQKKMIKEKMEENANPVLFDLLWKNEILRNFIIDEYKDKSGNLKFDEKSDIFRSENVGLIMLYINENYIKKHDNFGLVSIINNIQNHPDSEILAKYILQNSDYEIVKEHYKNLMEEISNKPV